MATADEVRAAYDQLHAAAKVLAGVRNVRVRVAVEWQQIGDLAPEVVAGLEHAMGAAARGYLAMVGLPLGDVATHAKSDCLPTLEHDQFLMALPVIMPPRSYPIEDEATIRAALWATAPAHDWSMPHDARYDDWQACPPNCPHLVYVVKHGLHEARPAQPAPVPR